MELQTNISDREPRQAVVIIHGIGEQIPMETLRGFVTAVTGSAPGDEFNRRAESKPDYISPTLELRRMAVPGEGNWEPGQWVSTDFYELYWAHLMAGTAWRHVSAWVATLLLRKPSAVPARLKKAWGIAWLVVIAALLLLGTAGPLWLGKITHVWPPLIVVIAGALIWLCRQTGAHFGLQYAGDAARYLSPRPENVGIRRAIRSAAVELLEGLHDDLTWRRYHRIIVVGHSLGSVIAYDALTHLWQRRHHPPESVFPTQADPKLEERLYSKDSLAAADSRELQSAIWREQRTTGVRWKITDFVTLGSPLAHAPFLMASDQKDFEDRVAQREYPTCPPQPNDKRDWQYGKSLLTTSGGGKLLHHAALFACTRWTNLFYDRDIIGGRIDDLGCWIDNHKLEPCGSAWFPHTKYWSPGANHTRLLKALDLCGWWKIKANVSTAIGAHHRDSGC